MISKEIRQELVDFLKKILKPSIAIDIEESTFEFSKIYAEDNNTPFLLEEIYKAKIDDIKKILGKENLEYVIKLIKEDNINPKEFAFLKPSDFDSKFQKIKQKQSDIENKNKPKGTNTYQCEKCKKRRATVEEKQTRAADEPATLYVTCLECGHVTVF